MRFLQSRRAKIYVGATLILFALAGVILLLLPELARRLAVNRLQRQLVAEVSIDDVDLNLFTGRATISGFRIESREGKRALLGIPAVTLRFSPLPLLRGGVKIQDLRILRPELRLERTAPERFNVMEVVRLPPGEADKKESPGARVTVESLTIQQGTIVFVDGTVSPHFEHTVKNVMLKTGRISTLPDLLVKPTSFEIRLDIEEGALAVSGQAAPISRPLALEFTAKWKNLNPALFEAYLPARPRIDLEGSRSSGEIRYILSPKTDEHYLIGSTEMGPASVLAPDSEEPVLAWSALSGREIRWDFLRDGGWIGELVLRQPRLSLVRDSGGFNVVRAFEDGGKLNGTVPEPSEEESAPAAFPLTIGRLEIQSGRIAFLDRGVTPQVKTAFEEVRLSVIDFALAEEAKPGRLTAEARLENSPVRVEGSLGLYPFTSRLQVSTQNLSLEPYEGYLRSAWKTLDDWRGRLDGEVEMDLESHRDGIGLELNGRLSARELTFGVARSREPPLQVREMDIHLASLRTHPSFFLDLARLRIGGAELRIRRNGDGSFNLGPLWAAEGRESQPAPNSKKDGAPPLIIRSLVAEESSIRFSDAAVDTGFETALTNVALKMQKLGNPSGVTPVSLEATLEESAKIELKGSIKPFESPMQVRLDGIIRDYDLAHLNPYATKYIRYEIARGRVTTDIEYAYDAGDLAGENAIAIRHLQLGKRLGDEFEERVGIPLRLAVALLQDADGRIRLAVPVRGDLTDPQFDLGGIIWKAVRNALERVLSAPLRLLGNMVTLGGRITRIRVDPVEFEAGSADLKPKSEEQLKELARFLKDRPKLELELRGLASTQEREELKRRRLRRRIQESGEPYEKAIARLYREENRAEIKGGEESNPGLTLKEMESYLVERSPLSREALRDLAAARVASVEEKLAEFGIDLNRLFGEREVIEGPPGARVEFEFLS